MCVLRGVRAGVSHGGDYGEAGAVPGTALGVSDGANDVYILRRGLSDGSVHQGRPDREGARRGGRTGQSGTVVREGAVRAGLRAPSGSADGAFDPKEREVGAGHLGRCPGTGGVQIPGAEGAIRRRCVGGAVFGQVHERGELRVPEVRAHRVRDEQRGSLCAAVSRFNGGGIGRGLWKRGDDEFGAGDRGRGCDFGDRIEYDRGASRDRKFDQARGRIQGREADPRGSAGDRVVGVRDGVAASEERDGRGVAEWDHARDPQGGLAGRGVHCGAHGGVRGIQEGDRGIYAGARGGDHGDSGGADRGGRADLCSGGARHDCVFDGDHPAYDGGG